MLDKIATEDHRTIFQANNKMTGLVDQIRLLALLMSVGDPGSLAEKCDTTLYFSKYSIYESSSNVTQSCPNLQGWRNMLKS